MMCASLICVSFGGKETREQAFAVLLAAESFYLPGPVGLFLFSLFLSFFFCRRKPCDFSKAFEYNNLSCGSAHSAHFAGVNVKKTKCC